MAIHKFFSCAVLFLFFFTMNSFALDPPFYICNADFKFQQHRAKELQDLAQADQADRQDWDRKTADELSQIAKRDLQRRLRVGRILGEGCFKDPKDYLAAALIYQHGNTPDHFYQAFIWSKKAADLGDIKGQYWSAKAIDRYLINIDHKQLFGTQFAKAQGEQCLCMQPVEQSVPDDFRKSYEGHTLAENYELMIQLDTTNHNCPKVECRRDLQPSPKGTVPGLW